MNPDGKEKRRMKFSLIVPTINRAAETERLFQSLAVQRYQDLEVIVVDQNPDENLVYSASAFIHG